MSNKSKRILLFSTNYLPHIGGAEIALKEITDRIESIHFDLITSRLNKSLPRTERIGNINIYRVGSVSSSIGFLLPKNFFPISSFLKAWRLTKKFGPYDSIFALQASQGAGGAWLYKIFNKKIPFILNVQEGKELKKQGILFNFFRNLIIKKADPIIVISQYLRDYIKKINKNANLFVIPNGVDVKKIKNQKSEIKIEELKKFLGIKSDEKVIITVSRLVHKNGIEVLINAFLKIADKIPVKLLIIGSGEMEKFLKCKILNLKLQNHAILLGEKPHDKIFKYLAIADIFVRPSYSEGLGTAFLEAMAFGVPIIGTKVGGISDFLKDRETGLFCEVDNSKDLSDKIQEVLDDDQLRNKLSENGRKLVEEKFNWDNIARQYKEIWLQN